PRSLSPREATQKIVDTTQRTGLNENADARVADLSVGDQQRVEIIKALYKGVSTLIMDEPTAVLTPQETDELFRVLRGWVKEGNTVIFITHKMREVVCFCDRVSILRDGHFIETAPTGDLSEQEIAEMMVGHKVTLAMDKKELQVGDTVLDVKELTVPGIGGVEAVKNVSFVVREGEVLGIAGVDGNGQSELISAIIGLTKASAGEVRLNGENILGRTPKQILDMGLSNIPFSRQTEGTVMSFSVVDNLILKEEWNPPYCRHGVLQKKVIQERSREMIEKYSIKANDPDTRVENMSGGNQQKVIIAREIEREHKLLLACHPTHGLDIGATEFIHRCLIGERDAGKAVLLVSTELDELLSLSDRIIVMFKGEIMGEVTSGHFEPSKIGLMMAGQRQEMA
ncbi:MAG: ATP-binding cassette domain-containing protein, partial [Lachnospiraceae bacterium]|nr:ATP-binding cassette domain-containing protein [Lachnospiraceae bacterium]